MNDDENEFFRSRHYVPRDRPPFHPLADHFPMMDRTSPEFKGLVASIRANGLWEPITMHQGKVLDGRNRLLACEEARIEPRFEDFDDTETTALDFVLAKNLFRRHLSVGQRAMKAEEMVTSSHGDSQRLYSHSQDKDFNDIAPKTSKRSWEERRSQSPRLQLYGV
jgi:ParB-like chromosome segregation protein Spo0J